MKRSEEMRKWKFGDKTPKLSKAEMAELDRKTEEMLQSFGIETVKVKRE